MAKEKQLGLPRIQSHGGTTLYPCLPLSLLSSLPVFFPPCLPPLPSFFPSFHKAFLSPYTEQTQSWTRGEESDRVDSDPQGGMSING